MQKAYPENRRLSADYNLAGLKTEPASPSSAKKEANWPFTELKPNHAQFRVMADVPSEHKSTIMSLSAPMWEQAPEPVPPLQAKLYHVRRSRENSQTKMILKLQEY